jgi:hypothetical protein
LAPCTNDPILEWLPERLEDGARELGRRPWDMQRFAVVGVGQSVGQERPPVASHGSPWHLAPRRGDARNPLLPVLLQAMPPAGFEPALQP